MDVRLHFNSYIAHPYWAEREELVNIAKQSGLNRVRSEDKRDQALRRYLEKQGMSMEDYQLLEKLAARQWYKLADANDGEIIIPRHQFSGALVEACKSAPAGARFNADQLRSLLDIRDFRTGKFGCDRLFSRFVLPKDGKGNPLSNQRARRVNEVIDDFIAEGTIHFDTDDVKQKSVVALLNYAGKYIGVGASRKMGYGRFQLLDE